jgi:zinc/manganese transport system substrate-binding protein
MRSDPRSKRSPKRRSWLWLAAVLAAALGTTAAAPARAAVRVVASVPDLAALTREIGGDAVSVKALSLPTQDPHFVDAKPSLALDLNRADLLVYVGLDLEIGWLPTLLVGARNPEVQAGARGNLDCSQFVHKLDLPTGTIDRSHGDIHPGGNPHYLYDPRAAEACARGIAQRLAELDPGHAAQYRQGADRLVARLGAARVRWEKAMAPFKGTPVVGYHKTWTYFADWLGLEQVGFLEPKPGIPPNPQHVARLLALAQARGVKVILQEEHYPDATARLVAARIPAALVREPAGTDFARGESYVQHMDRVIEALATALGGKR